MKRLEDLSSGKKRYRIDLSAIVTVDAERDDCCALGCPWLDNYHTLDCTLFRSSLEEVNLPAPKLAKDLGTTYSYYKRCDKCLEAMSGVVEL